jgi:CRISPR-associated protein Cmr5
MSQQKTLEQKRAKQAWDDVRSVKEKSYEFQSDYATIALRASSLIQSSGLGQTLAFLKAKGKGQKENAHEVLFKHLSGWVTGQFGWSKDLLREILERDSADYRRATAEALAYLNWHKRFVEAYLERREGAG